MATDLTLISRLAVYLRELFCRSQTCHHHKRSTDENACAHCQGRWNVREPSRPWSQCANCWQWLHDSCYWVRIACLDLGRTVHNGSSFPGEGVKNGQKSSFLWWFHLIMTENLFICNFVWNKFPWVFLAFYISMATHVIEFGYF